VADLTHPFELWGQPVHEIAYADVNGRRLVVARGGPPGGEVRVFDADSGVAIAEYSIGGCTLYEPGQPILAGYRGGRAVVNVSIDHRARSVPGLGRFFVRQLELASGEPTGVAVPSAAAVVGLGAYAAEDRDVLVVAGEDGSVSQVDHETGEQVRPVIRHLSRDLSAFSLVTTDVGPIGVIGSRDGRLTAWDLNSAQLRWDERSEGVVFAVDLRAVGDRTYLAVVRGFDHVEIRDATNGKEIGARIALDNDFPARIGMGVLNNRAVLYLGNGEMVDRIDIGSGEKLGPTIAWPDEISGVQPMVVAGRDILFVVDDYVMRVLDAASGDMLVGSIDET
jgi:hypothetical protein